MVIVIYIYIYIYNIINSSSISLRVTIHQYRYLQGVEMGTRGIFSGPSLDPSTLDQQNMS